MNYLGLGERIGLLRKVVSGIVLMLLLTSMLSSASVIQPVKAEWTGTVYIRADGSIDPPDAPIITYDNVTYILTDNITSSADGIVVERDNIVIDGLGHLLQGSGSDEGIDLSGRTNVTVKNLRIMNFTYGIRLNQSTNCLITGENITANNYYGIYLYGSSNNTVSENNIANNGDGIILVSHSSNNTISENTITANIGGPYYGAGVVLGSSSNTVSENNITNHRFGIWLKSSPNNSISGNNITNNTDGIVLDYASNNTVSENTITTNNWDGIRLRISSNNIISKNNITTNDRGISFDRSSNNTIFGNNITNNEEGIYLYFNSNNNTVSGNNITANNDYGIWLSGSSNNNSICGNNITNNERGIFIYESSNNSITGNNITNNVWSMELQHSSRNTISRNTIAASYEEISLADSSNNNIYHNSFIDDSPRVYDYSWDFSEIPPSINVWDDGYPSGGNYWSDYAGVDLFSGPYQNETGSDGIGDTSYVIDENNTDRYPLMGPFNSFNTSVGYPVDIISNSTIQNFQYFKSNRTIVMHVSNVTANQTVGFCRLTIPHDVISPPYTVKVNGTTLNFQTIYENYTEGISIIYFTYEHSNLEITVIPEFSSAMILPLFTLTTLIATILLKKKRKTKSQLP